MAKRGSRGLPPDFHLWTTVSETVEPLRRPKLVRGGNAPLPLPVEAPAPSASKPPPAKLPPRQPFLPPYQAPRPLAALPDKAVEPSVRKKLGRGRIEIEGRIDLHGMTQIEARGALHRFIQARWARGDRTVLVITGKGRQTNDDFIAAMTERGVLRTMLPIWLSEPSLAPLVSGWSAAARGHGGEGAWYVRLRRA